jgi:CHAT domain-containing protein
MAIKLYQEAQATARKAGSGGLQSESLAWKSLAESFRLEQGQALADAQEAVYLAEQAGSADQQALALNALESIQIELGDLTAAAATINRELVAADRSKDPMRMVYALLGRHKVYYKQGSKCDYKVAFQACKKSLDQANSDIKKSIQILQRLGYTYLVMNNRIGEQSVEGELVYLRSREQLAASLQIPSKAFSPKDANRVIVNEQFVSANTKDKQMRVVFQQTQRLIQGANKTVYAAEDARMLSLKGDIKSYEGDINAALDFYLQAVAMVERDRRKLRDERSRGIFSEEQLQYYNYPILEFLQRRQYAKAFDLLERSRSRVFADLLSSRRLNLRKPPEQRLYAEAMLLQTRIADQQTKLFDLNSQPVSTATAAKVKRLKDTIRALEAQHQAVLSRMGTEAPQLKDLVVSAPATLQQLQQSMREENYELLQYQVLEFKLILWHITSDSVFVRSIFLPRLQMKSKLAALQRSLVDHNTAFNETVSKELFLYLIQPALSRIRSDHLVIIPHDDLNNLPFQVLQDPVDGRYLGERFKLTYAPSVSVQLGLKRSKSPFAGRLYAVGDPSIGDAGPEIEAIAKLFPAGTRTVMTNGVREDQLKTQLGDVDVVHLALHGKYNASEPMLSYLSLEPGGSDDGQLTAAEMFALPLAQSPLVVLSGCETGRAEASRGNEIQGMARALIYAGAASMVLSQWRVDSAATALWMQTFYQSAMAKSIPAAARDALTRVKANPAYRHPYYWAAFTVISR